MTRFAQLRRLYAFFRSFVAYDPPKVALSVGLTLLLGVLQGFGVLMLIPLLAYVGLVEGEGGGAVASIAAFFFEGIGLPRSLPVILAVYVGLAALRAVVVRWESVLNTDLRLGFVRALRLDLYEALAHARWRYFLRVRQSDLLHTLMQETSRAGQAAYMLLSGAITAALLGVYFLIALQLSVTMTLVTCLSAGLLSLFLKGRFSAAHDTGLRLRRFKKRIYGLITDHLGGMKELRSYGAEARSVAELDAATHEINDSQLDFTRDTATADAWVSIGTVVVLSLLLLLAVEVFALPLAALLLLIFLFARMMPQVTRLQQTALQVVNVLPAFDAVQETLAEARAAAEPPATEAAPRLTRAVEIDGVTFRYRPEAERPTLDAVRFELPARSTTALVGPSGAGKSTLAHLLMGLLTPDDGAVRVDGEALQPEQLAAWRRRIGYVPQETFLLHDTVRQNLLWARPEADEAALWQALRQAAAEGFVRALPHGLDTVVGDRGVRLSGGERQRVALARALLRAPDLLLLDEATSSLDLENERRIYEAVGALHGAVTVLIITHRLTSLRDVDRIVVIEAGRVVQAGTWAELHEEAGRFADLLRAPVFAQPEAN